MGFANNSTLVTSAKKIVVAANGSDGEVYDATASADAFLIAGGDTGDDVILGFSANDTIITTRMLSAGYVQLGPNQVLAVDASAPSAPGGDDHVTVLGRGADLITELRYLGFKDGGYAYADAGTRDSLFGRFANGFQSTNQVDGDTSVKQALRIDNDVTSSTFDMGKASVALLTDNALGLNFGGDTINGFGDDDLLIFTSKLLNANSGSSEVTFGRNLVLDTSGAEGPQSSDPVEGPGGQMDLQASSLKSIYYLGQKFVDGTAYYYYGTEHATQPDGVYLSA